MLDGVSRGGVSGRGGPSDPTLIPEGCNCTVTNRDETREKTTEAIPSRTEGAENFKLENLYEYYQFLLGIYQQ